jgi:hypothetical protein
LSIGSLGAPAAQVRPLARPAAPAPPVQSNRAVPRADRPGWSLAALYGAQSSP